MGGDHRCSVCQATFTRPQHVARHMRSHTGDRPYQCLYCGDQFARSDLLSRHVNKCHSNEKPPPSATIRKKGSAASRATTSKQACDQCVQSSLPCDGANPCIKCTQRKYRCTFVKFHRQTAPAGPGHAPPPAPALSNPTPLDSRLRANPPPGSVGALYTDTFDFPPIYPPRIDLPSATSDSSTDYTARYRANAHNILPSMRDSGPMTARPGMYPLPPANSWPSWDQGSTQDSQDTSFSNFDHKSGGGFGLSPTIPSYPMAIPQHRRQSLDYSGSDSSTSLSETSSVSSTSAASSSAHLPLSLPVAGHMPAPGSFQGSSMRGSSFNSQLHQIQTNYASRGHHDIRPATSPTSPTSAAGPLPIQQSQSQPPPRTEGSFSSAFGEMSLEDAKVLAGLAADGAPFFSHAAIGMDANTDPDATPMPMQMNQGPNGHSQHEDPSRLQKASQSHVQWSSSVQSFPTPSRERDKEADTRELRDLWRDYMRTPLSGPGLTDSPGGGMYRRPRVNSLPSKKTPLGGPGGSGEAYGYSGTPISSQVMAGTGMGMSVPHFMPMLLPRRPSTGLGTPMHGSTSMGQGQGQQPQTHQVRHGHGSADDLRSYEAAVLARKAPTNLSLKPRKRRTTEGSSPGQSGSASVDASPIVPSMLPSALRSGGGPMMKMEEEEENGRGGDVQSRGWERMDVETGSPTTFKLFSLANVFGNPQVDQGTGWRHSPVSRESSVSVSDGSSGGCGGGEGGPRGGSPGDMLRPAFKRLPSQTLEPVNAKRTQLMGPGEGGSDEDGVGREPPVMTIAQRRRMSGGGGRGTVPASMDLGLGSFEKW